jgi:hypothetical protein
MRRLAAALTGALALTVLSPVAATTGATQPPTPTQAPSSPTAAPPTEPPVLQARVLRSYDAFDANQGVGVDRRFFYAVDNSEVTRHDRRTGAPLLQYAGVEEGPLEHLDSGVVVGRRLYAAHSNYNESPMESSVEIFDTRTMRHVATHSFGVERGSLTWLDRHDGAWWAGFANYDRIPEGETEPYGGTYNTQVVRLDDDFRVTDGWTIPKPILDRFKPMSNSGGSWGPDGRLWLTGHDLGEAYVMTLPEAGSTLRWVATVELPGVEGQGIAWDLRGREPSLWAIKRSTSQVLRFAVLWRRVQDDRRPIGTVNGPGSFQR